MDQVLQKKNEIIVAAKAGQRSMWSNCSVGYHISISEC